MNIQVPLSVPFFHGKEKEYVESAITSTWVSSGGRYITDFEQKIAEYNMSAHGIACASGTAALHVALLESGVTRGDEVIVPTVTFIAPVNVVHYVGAIPVFMDCDNFLNVDCNKLEDFLRHECELRGNKLINKKTGNRVSAVLPVHVFGHPVDLVRLTSIASDYNLPIVEDATESLGSYYKTGSCKGKKTGAVGNFGCFSFNGNKIITTGGGGMVVTDAAAAARHIKYITTQAKDDDIYYIHNEIGFNYRMTNLQAALGLAQLESIDTFIQKKRNNYFVYRELLDGCRGISLIDEPVYGHSNYWFYSLVVDEDRYGISRDDLLKKLLERGIESRPLWTLNHLQKPYKDCQAFRIDKAYRYQRQVLNIPCSVGLTEEEQKSVVKLIRNRS